MKKVLFPAANLICITCLAYLSVQTAYLKMGIDPSATVQQVNPVEKKEIRQKQVLSKKKTLHRKNNTIVKRNLFNVLTKKEVPQRTHQDQIEEAEKIARVPLQINLKGTVTGGSDLYVVIEDKKKKKQGLYRAGEAIDGGVLKQVFTDYVLIERNGEAYRLEMSTPEGSANAENPLQPGPKSTPVSDDTVVEIPLDDNFISKSFSNLDNLKTQVKSRFYHKNGKRDGILLYGIRPGSAFKTMGLQNGDVIREINGASIENMHDLLKTLQDLSDTGTAGFSILRGGRPRQVNYKVNRTDEG